LNARDYLDALRTEFDSPEDPKCPGTDLPCVHALAWSHPCDRDEAGTYECQVPHLAKVFREGSA
jgi:hypothetical protein